MKRDFKTIKNLILLIASALTLVAVTFSWFSMSRKGNFEISTAVSGSTLSVRYFESTDGGKNYSQLNGDLSMSEMVEGKTAYYKMNIKTFNDKLIKLIMSFDGLSASNTTAQYVYFDYKLCTSEGKELLSETGLKMSDYASNNIFAYDVSTYQKNGNNDFVLYYNVYVKTDGTAIPNANQTVSLGSVKLLGQQVN